MADILDSGAYKLADSISLLLHRAYHLASDRFSHLVGEDAVTLRQFAVLAAIAEQPGLSQAELVRATGIDRSSLADILARMEDKKWIARTPHGVDGRAKAVRLDDAGRQYLAAWKNHARASDAAILDALGKPERKTLAAILLKLAKLSDERAAESERSARKGPKSKSGGKKGRKRNRRVDARAAAAAPGPKRKG